MYLYRHAAWHIVLFVIAISSSESIFSHNNRPNDQSYRLPNATHPVAYEISIVSRVDLGSFDFKGNVKIRIVVNETTQEIVLHAKQLQITNIKLGRFRGMFMSELMVNPHEHDHVREILVIRTNQSALFEGDNLLLELDYVGSLRNDRKGFYRSSYVNDSGITR